MWVRLGRFLALVVVLAVVVGTTVPVAASAMGQMNGASHAAGMTGAPAGPDSPCTGSDMPSCVDHLGCLTPSALPAAPAAVAVAFAWIELHYQVAPQSLSGISVKPELAPPILLA